MIDSRIAERRKVYEQHWSELMDTVRAWRPEIADQIASLALLCFGSQDGTPHDKDVIATSKVFSEEKYPSPKKVVIAVLQSLGGRATRDEIATTALEGGWRNPGGKKPYYDVWDAVNRLAKDREVKRGKLVIRMVDEETAELIE